MFPNFFPGEYGQIKIPHHLRSYTPKSLNSLFNHTGFIPIKVKSTYSSDVCWGEWFVNNDNYIYQLIFWLGAKLYAGTLLYGYGKKMNKPNI